MKRDRKKSEERRKGIMTGKLCLGGKWSVYVNKDLEGKLKKLREWMEDGRGEGSNWRGF